MLIICPSCEASYEVDPADLGAAGRTVRCAECGAKWHARGEFDFLSLDDTAEVAPVPVAEVLDGEDAFDDDDADADEPGREFGLLENFPQDVAFRDAAPSRRDAKRKGTSPRPTTKTRAAALVAAAGLAVLAVLGIWRQTVVEFVPDLAGLYAAAGMRVNLRGLEFRDVITTETSEGGVPLLVVRGTIENVTGGQVDVPRLRLSVRGSSGREIFVWTAMPAKTNLEAGESLPFFAQLASPPAEGREVAVRFISTRDTAQNLAAR